MLTANLEAQTMLKSRVIPVSCETSMIFYPSKVPSSLGDPSMLESPPFSVEILVEPGRRTVPSPDNKAECLPTYCLPSILISTWKRTSREESSPPV